LDFAFSFEGKSPAAGLLGLLVAAVISAIEKMVGELLDGFAANLSTFRRGAACHRLPKGC
jgi:hypothetical protein